ncbi:hypothetical protein GMDG_05835 [Pseudogymnoascus destructans 20631-21]|uniref:FAD/NAD(P)-binding domain-containing protein n=2 Tax=Pseudogymnoascus destructans TaxID=655981 RepID=L8FR77_PSED2|nr:hypothetical protein GMDG_05835 [Pseudogymnoascus destructans 20631-21]
MEFSQEPIPVKQTSRSIQRHGPSTPFRHHTVVQGYIEGLLDRKGYKDFVECGVTVERVEKVDASWKLTLRKAGSERDYWWAEEFDAVVVASGHYTVPHVPHIEGLKGFASAYLGSVEHSKGYRGAEKYRQKNVVVIGASVSGMDIARDLIGVAQHPINAVVRGKWHPYFGKSAFDHSDIKTRPAVKRIESAQGRRTIILEDGSHIDNVDNIILGTGYSLTLPFLPDFPVTNNRLPGLYLHIFQRQDPTLAFVGAIAAGFTFKAFEWQAVLAARYFAGRVELPSIAEQEKWETDRIAVKGDGVPFTALYPNFEEYFETVRELAGEPAPGQPGRRLPKFGKGWRELFDGGHQRRIEAWKKENETRSKMENSVAVKARL